MFIDRARLLVRGGDGGRGVISFRREAHVPRGGPDGGDGGKGGDIVLRVEGQLGTLSDFRFAREMAAEPGRPGAGRNSTGRSGADRIVRVPPGTLVIDRATGETVADLVAPGDELVVARGGTGGKGNARFATSTRRAPRIAEDGGKGERREIDLELKLLADVGLAGMPNAGKSTLLAALTSARPKIADYPFTTLVPNLGVARLEDRELVVADIPGLIEGASRGLGLGEEFLRHIERTRLLVHVVDASRPDPLEDITTIETELASYGRGLMERPRLVALNKIDLPEAREAAPRIARALAERGIASVAVSAAARQGTDDLLRQIFAGCPPREAAGAQPARERRIAFAGGARDWRVKREGAAFRIEGDRVERLASGIDWDSPDASAYFQRQLIRTGIEGELRALGAKEGDTVRIGSLEMEWSERAEDE
ncbi:MAG: GTPase ObgE [Chloroflexi bacterium]|nr:MAG: GTPase ObgE [Chloroflexota bacterium]